MEGAVIYIGILLRQPGSRCRKGRQKWIRKKKEKGREGQSERGERGKEERAGSGE